MELYLQFGYGMMDHCRSLLKDWSGGSVILSPRDLNDEQLTRLSGEIHERNGNVLLDPQFYLPNADHSRLVSHDYWPDEYNTTEFWSGAQLNDLIKSLIELNTCLDCKDFILPGLYAQHVDDDWLALQKMVFDEVAQHDTSQFRCFGTVALSGDATRNNDQIHRILDDAANWEMDGIYLVCEHSNGEYLVNDPNWLANVLDLTAGFRLRGKRVILGYCNHQMLIAASASADAIASGTWMNVRSFPPSKFLTAYEDEIKQRTKWYYCPEALSEYKINYLDIAQRLGVLDNLKTPFVVGGDYAAELFIAAQPSIAEFTEQQAFRHYLYSLHYQVLLSTNSSFDTTLAAHQESLDKAETLLSSLRSNRISGQKRDFSEIIDTNRAALAVLTADRGPVLRHFWGSL